MQLEVGKSYKNRLRQVKKITYFSHNRHYPYRDRDGLEYYPDGTAENFSDNDLIEEVIETTQEKQMIDLLTIKAEDILMAGRDVALIVDRKVVCKQLHNNGCQFLIVSDNGDVSYVNNGHSYITLKPKKVKYLKPLHVVLSDPRTIIDSRNRFSVNGIHIDPDMYSLFGKPINSDLNWCYAPEWIEEREAQE